jgi:hypothetical protein
VLDDGTVVVVAAGNAVVVEVAAEVGASLVDVAESLHAESRITADAITLTNLTVHLPTER